MVTIDDLPDDDLLTIFDFHMFKYQGLNLDQTGNYEIKRRVESWQSLVHVCRRWRGLVFGSPRRLDLQLFSIPGTLASTRLSLDIWPALPLLIRGYVLKETALDDVIAELKQSDRISQIDLDCHSTLQIEKLWTALQVPFPVLEVLHLSYEDVSYVPVLPDSFLGGSAQRLRFLRLASIPSPGLPNLLLSATHLVHFTLLNIPHSGYISPETMATCLSVLSSLESLQLEFGSPQSSPDQESRRPPLPTRFVLPALEGFSFKGVNEYLESLLAHIDAPRFYRLSAKFFNDIDFNTSELNQFISRTPTFGTHDGTRLIFRSRDALVRLRPFQPERSDHRMVQVTILCQVSNWQLSSLAQICTLSFNLFLTIENLWIHEDLSSPPSWKDDIENTEWLDLLLPFIAVKNLYLSKKFSPHIACALQELSGGRTTEVLPALQNVFLEGFQSSEPFHEGIRQFISARQLTNLPVAISVWERDLEQETL